MTEPGSEGYDSEAAEGREGFRDAAVRAVTQARMQIALFSQSLDRDLYGTDDFIVPLTTFLLAHERAQLRVLLRRPDGAALSGHRLVELGRRLSSRVSFRTLSQERQPEYELLVVDESAVLLRATPQEVTARYWPQAPLLARERQREFEALWQDAEPSAELRSMSL
ncbi:MAG TPA: hypothetical protein VN046_11970 [Stenotrophobium sp.]|jgi:hypothetical protein|nr:hypothetical protein [Stenotrophobium sp.]